MNNWNWHPTIPNVVNIRNAKWWNENAGYIINWLKTENLYMNSHEMECPNLILYTAEQAAYFTLRWPQNV